MTEYCEKCKRCHDDGLRNDEECCYYGEPNGCNHPNHGYGVIVDKYEALQKENAELRECLKEAFKRSCRSVVECKECVFFENCYMKKWKAVLEGAN